LGVTGTISSPTYTLMEHYRTQVREVLHLDLYRLNDPLELHNLGLADYPPALMQWLVEWPQRGAGVLPNADICIRIDPAGGGRKADISGLKQAEEEAIDGKA
ncbi:MAG: tRNA (adenosine(37)-N6)-threonylcarbamoyltransferase complex ATPase subunit type 1 TsaE, partial [Stenotrophobium sp.]